MGLSIMEQAPGWEQALRAFNQGNHESYIDQQHWVGEQRMDNIVPSEASLALSGMGDGTSQPGTADGWGVFQNVANTGLQIWQQSEQVKQQARQQAIQTRLQKQQSGAMSHAAGGAGGGGDLFGMNTNTLLLIGAVIIGGVILFSVMGKKKKGDGEHHAA